MPAFTTRFGLYKPGGGSTGTITPDETTDIDKLNADFDIIDANLGLPIYTSVTRPASPKNGQGIYESDTGMIAVYSQSAANWLYPNSTPVIADLNALPVAAPEGRRYHIDLMNVDFQAIDGVWVQQGVASFSSTANRDTEYAKVGGVYKVLGAKALDTSTGLTSTYINSTLGWLVDIITVQEGIFAAASNLGASAAGVTVDLVASALTFPAMPFPTIIELDYLSVVTQSSAATRGYTANFTATAGTLTNHYNQRSGEPAGGSSIQIAWTLGSRATLVLPAATASDVKLTGTPSDNGMTVAASQYRYRRRTS